MVFTLGALRAHLPRLFKPRDGLVTIPLVQTSFASFNGGVVKTLPLCGRTSMQCVSIPTCIGHALFPLEWWRVEISDESGVLNMRPFVQRIESHCIYAESRFLLRWSAIWPEDGHCRRIREP